MIPFHRLASHDAVPVSVAMARTLAVVPSGDSWSTMLPYGSFASHDAAPVSVAMAPTFPSEATTGAACGKAALRLLLIW